MLLNGNNVSDSHERLKLMDSLKVLHLDSSLSLCKHQCAFMRLKVKFRDEIDGHLIYWCHLPLRFTLWPWAPECTALYNSAKEFWYHIENGHLKFRLHYTSYYWRRPAKYSPNTFLTKVEISSSLFSFPALLTVHYVPSSLPSLTWCAPGLLETVF